MSNQYDNRVNVNFPDKMKIQSPELDSVKRSTETIMSILQKNMSSIIEPLQNLNKLPELFRNVSETITENFKNLFTTNIESDVLNRQAVIKVMESKTGFIKAHIEKKKKHADAAVEAITADYKNYFTELANEQESYLNNLDRHAYNIIEKIYPQKVEKEFFERSYPCMDFLSEHITKCGHSRTDCINEILEVAENEVLRFTDERNSFYSKIDENGIGDIKEGFYEMDCWFIEAQDQETGMADFKVFIPGLDGSSNTEISNKALDDIKDAIQARSVILDKHKSNSDLLDSICSVLKNTYGISHSEISRFKENCQSTIIEK